MAAIAVGIDPDRYQGARPLTAPVVASGATRAGGGGMRLTTRGRVVVLLLSLGLIAGGGAVLGSVAEASAPSRGVAVARHVVTSGETLWAVAREISRPGDDLRDVVADIEDLNRLSSAQLQPGQVLWLPVSTGARR